MFWRCVSCYNSSTGCVYSKWRLVFAVVVAAVRRACSLSFFMCASCVECDCATTSLLLPITPVSVHISSVNNTGFVMPSARVPYLNHCTNTKLHIHRNMHPMDKNARQYHQQYYNTTTTTILNGAIVVEDVQYFPTNSVGFVRVKSALTMWGSNAKTHGSSCYEKQPTRTVGESYNYNTAHRFD